MTNSPKNRNYYPLLTTQKRYQSFFAFSGIRFSSGVPGYESTTSATQIWDDPPTDNGAGDVSMTTTGTGFNKSSTLFARADQVVGATGDDIWTGLLGEASTNTRYKFVDTTTQTDPSSSFIGVMDWWDTHGSQAPLLFDLQAAEQKIVMLPCRFRTNVGGVGNDPAFLSTQEGFTSIVRNGAGDFTLTLSDNYQEIYHMDLVEFDLSDDSDLITNIHTKTANSIRFVNHVEGVADDGAANMDMMACLYLKNSTI